MVLNGSATANPNATDATSRIANANCDPVSTSSAGQHTINCSATDKAGNTASAIATYTVNYGICVLDDQTAPHKRGSTVPIKLQLCDASGADQSSPAVVVQATAVTQVDRNASALLDDTGSSNTPDYNFRVDPTLGVTRLHLQLEHEDKWLRHWNLDVELHREWDFSVELQRALVRATGRAAEERGISTYE